MKNDLEAKLWRNLKRRDVFLLVDGGTLNRTRLLNVSLGCDGVCYFYRSVRVPNLTTDQVLMQVLVACTRVFFFLADFKRIVGTDFQFSHRAPSVCSLRRG